MPVRQRRLCYADIVACKGEFVGELETEGVAGELGRSEGTFAHHGPGVDEEERYAEDEPEEW